MSTDVCGNVNILDVVFRLFSNTYLEIPVHCELFVQIGGLENLLHALGNSGKIK